MQKKADRDRPRNDHRPCFWSDPMASEPWLTAATNVLRWLLASNIWERPSEEDLGPTKRAFDTLGYDEDGEFSPRKESSPAER